MKHILHITVFALFFGSLFSSSGALTITNADVVNNHYVYSLTYGDMANYQTNNKFANDIDSSSSVVSVPNPVTVNVGSRSFIAPNMTVQDVNFKSASFIYKYDFSLTDYAITAATVTDGIFIFTNTESAPGTAKTEYSIDGSTWTTIRSITSTGTSQPSSLGTTVLNLGQQTETLYYRVTFETSGAGHFGYNSSWMQWNRVGETVNNPFLVDLTLTAVPEPGVAWLLVFGLGLPFGMHLRKRLASARMKDDTLIG